MLTVTTSWDDGDVLDTKLVALLDTYGIKGTLYISKEYRTERLTDDAIRALAIRHEIGAHTLTHPDLRSLSRSDKEREVRGGKSWLEDVIGKEVSMFCYPSGRFDAETKEVVREAGFTAARTVRQGVVLPTPDLFELDTTLHVYPLPFRKRDATHYEWRYLLQPLVQRGPLLARLGVPLHALRSFESAARAAYAAAVNVEGAVFHLWGHSWEIERYGMWPELERFLAFLKERKEAGECTFATNSEASPHL